MTAQLGTTRVGGTARPRTPRPTGADRSAIAGWAGMLAGPLFITVVVLLTAAEWDFLHRAGWTPFGANAVPYPSYTALGPYGAVQVANFLVTGLLVLAVVVASYDRFRGWSGWLARVLLTLAGLGMCTSAFRTDVVPGPISWHGAIHAISFVAVAGGATLGMLFAGIAMVSRGGGGFGVATIALALWQVVTFIVLGGVLPGDTNFYLFLVGLFSWVFALGLRLSSRR